MFRWLYALSYICSLVIGVYVGFHLGNVTGTILLNNLEAKLNFHVLNYLFQFLSRFWDNPQSNLLVLFSYCSSGLLAKQLIANHSTFYYFLNLRREERVSKAKNGNNNSLTNNLVIDLIWGILYILAQAIIPLISFWLVGIELFFKLFSLLWYFSIIPAWLVANFAFIHSTNLINIIFTPKDLKKLLQEF